MPSRTGNQPSLFAHRRKGCEVPATDVNPRTTSEWAALHDQRDVSLAYLRGVSANAEPVEPDRLETSPLPYEVRALTWRSSDFPTRLRQLKSPPPVLWAIGDVTLLRQPAFGLCGSRKASERGLRWARQFGAVVAESGAVVVTGLARGVDTEATVGALETGGNVIAVLPQGFGRWTPSVFRDPVRAGRMLVLSEFRPNAPWSVGQAMQRNITICCLGRAMFVIEAGTTGGTLDAGRAALRLGVPLFAIRSPNAIAGNEMLVREGAQPLHNLRELKLAIGEVLEH